MTYAQIRKTIIRHLFEHWIKDSNGTRTRRTPIVLENEADDSFREAPSAGAPDENEAHLSFAIDFGQREQTTMGVAGNRKFECNGFITGLFYVRRFSNGGTEEYDKCADAFQEIFEGKAIPDVDGGSTMIYVGGMSYKQIESPDDEGFSACSLVLPFQFDSVK